MILRVLITSLFACSFTVTAHTLLLKPDLTPEGMTLSLMMTEHFFEGERELDPSTVATQLISNSGVTWLTSTDQKTTKVVRYLTPSTVKGVMAFASATPRYRGQEKGKAATSAENRLRIDDFTKVVFGKDTRLSLVSGQKLEIVPLDHPSASLEKPIRLQVLWKGTPLASTLRVIKPNGDKAKLETDEQGVATLNVDNQGYWVVKVAYKLHQGIDEFSGAYEASASLLIDNSNTIK